MYPIYCFNLHIICIVFVLVHRIAVCESIHRFTGELLLFLRVNIFPFKIPVGIRLVFTYVKSFPYANAGG
jgi:hypothetical protein